MLFLTISALSRDKKEANYGLSENETMTTRIEDTVTNIKWTLGQLGICILY